ncbi:aminotransferase class V-fold PLP-dependent enzyme [Amycolatopsis rubida]|uniref:Aminotransferase class V-fold PLP-dependent enzyme n=1 Tax=Amycolatopsis rubida TaxID=112413 RepID=A0ABX0CD52_9PSEU|nr:MULTISPECIES: aminotransferase class V-fold PLP-dependent enzyme [Amycolatopsis]MYW97907.1 aminotransferase class V-fold PLP-dependent enzyme [Amycolatopsis rubida]NEC62893.1 aminotransferase class V-fold PLP-dependent enzyme [Amycolatopsis rubida]OAP23962.1 putative cysteine desulfurase [Amycolatopsis sp. M39]
MAATQSEAADSALGQARAEFAILREWAYFDSAGLGLRPERHVAQLRAEIARDLAEPLVTPGTRGGPLKTRLRTDLAELIGAGARDIGLVPTTAHGIHVFTGGYPWRSGDEVICFEGDFSTCIAPFQLLARQGVRLVMAPTGADGRIDIEQLALRITSRTRAVCVSAVNSETGARAPLPEIGALCHERGAWFVVDGIQSLGALQADVERDRIDLLAAQAYKFLLSGAGIGVCYVRPELAAELKPAVAGWHNANRVNEPSAGLPAAVGLADSAVAELCEPGAVSHVLMAGLVASLSLLAEVGPAQIEQHVLGLAVELRHGFADRGFRVLAAGPDDRPSHLVVVELDSLPAGALRRRLVEDNVVGSLRRRGIRFSPHLYNNEADVDRLFCAVDRALAEA